MEKIEFDKESGSITLSGTMTGPDKGVVIAHEFNVTLVSKDAKSNDDVSMGIAYVLGSIMQVYDEELAPDTKRLRGVLYAPDRRPGHPSLNPTKFSARMGFAHPFPKFIADGYTSDQRGEQRGFSVHVPVLDRFVYGVRDLLTKTCVDVIVKPGRLSMASGSVGNADDGSFLMSHVRQHLVNAQRELGTSSREYSLFRMNVELIEKSLPTGFITSTAPDRVEAFRAYIADYQEALAFRRNEMKYKAIFVPSRQEPRICGGD